MKKIGVLVGSLRKGSFTRKVALELMSIGLPGYEMELLEIGHLTHYNEDLEEDPPKEWLDFRKKIEDCQGFLFATPEYNRSLPGVLKNALDVASRPYGKNNWGKKPAGIVSVSPGALAAFGANHHLRQSCVFLDIYVMQQPEAYIGHISEMLDASGKLKDSKQKDFFVKYMEELSKWLGTFEK